MVLHAHLAAPARPRCSMVAGKHETCHDAIVDDDHRFRQGSRPVGSSGALGATSEKSVGSAGLAFRSRWL